MPSCLELATAFSVFLCSRAREFADLGGDLRLWSIHPKYLDAKGLVALWREGLLAKKVLENKTKGYRNHPQLERFKACQSPLGYINEYLQHVCDEADARGYTFDRTKLRPRRKLSSKLRVRAGQVRYEWDHLARKLKTRDPKRGRSNQKVAKPKLHPLFRRVAGGVEAWEVV
jgi:hypothetical protein